MGRKEGERENRSAKRLIGVPLLVLEDFSTSRCVSKNEIRSLRVAIRPTKERAKEKAKSTPKS